MADTEILNRVANSNIITIDLEEFYDPSERVLIDIKDQLYQGLILREKEFRQYIKSTNWSEFQDKNVAINCTADAIIPNWAYMLLTSALKPFAKNLIFGTLEDLEASLFKSKILALDEMKYQNAKVVIKGCSKNKVPVSAYVEITNKLLPVVSSIMFGEPCSTVPVYKQKAVIGS